MTPFRVMTQIQPPSSLEIRLLALADWHRIPGAGMVWGNAAGERVSGAELSQLISACREVWFQRAQRLHERTGVSILTCRHVALREPSEARALAELTPPQHHI